MGFDLSILNNPKVKALVTGAFLLGGVVFSLLTYFMIINVKSKPVEIIYNCGETLGTESIVPSNPVSSQSSDSPSPKGGSPSGRQSGGLVNINTASQLELESLPDIGRTRAKAIIEYRETKGEFMSTGELHRVNGIGPKTFEGIKDLITTK